MLRAVVITQSHLKADVDTVLSILRTDMQLEKWPE